MSETTNASSVEGFILAGGRSRRFGRDKALALWRDRPLLAWALGALEQVGLSATVVASEVEQYRSLTSRFLTSERPGRGPVEGVRVVLEACRSPWALVLSVDMPWVDERLLRPLLEVGRSKERAICFADSSGLRHPFPGLYQRSVLRLIDEQGPGGSMQQLLDAAAPRLLGPAELPDGVDLGAALRNANRPEDLR